MASWEQDIVNALQQLGGVASYDAIYSEVKKLRENLPKTWKDIIRRRVQDLSSDSNGFKNGRDLFYSVNGLGAGMWGLRTQLNDTPHAIDLPLGNNEPERKYTNTYRVLRDTNLARKLKLLHDNSCQICSLKIQMPNGKFYSEAHHIIPLGKPYDGPDSPENIIVLCPNHHVMFDYGAIRFNSKEVRLVSGHVISKNSIDYHNEKICKIGL